MKILFVHPSARSRFPEPPLGIASLASLALGKNCKVAFYDEDKHNKSFVYEDIIREFNPDILAVSFMTSQFAFARNLIDKAKRIKPDLPVIVGGVHAAALPEDTMLDIGDVDYLCYGEGEKTFVDFIDYTNGIKGIEDVKGLLFRKKGKVIKNLPMPLLSIEELNELPMPAWDVIYKHGSYLSALTYWNKIVPVYPVITARGCSFNCTFCDEGTIWNRKLREREMDAVIYEMNGLIKKWGAEHFNILDDTFTLKPKRVKEFCDKILINKFNIKWRCTAKVGTVTPEMLSHMKKAGCKLIAYGVECGDQKVLDLMRKKQTLEQVKDAFRITKEAGMMSFALCMVGKMGEDLESVKKTARFVSELGADLFSCAVMTPYPGSGNFEVCKKNGWILHYDWDKWVPTPINIKEFVPVSRTVKMDRHLMLKSYYYLNRKFLISKLVRRYGKLFFVNPRLYYNEIIARLKNAGLHGFTRHMFRLFGILK